MKTIAFYGAGMLGSGFVRSLLRNGYRVNVWNRSPEKARALEADGARAFDRPDDAARGADRMHVCVSDDAAVDAVIDGALPALGAGVPVVDHTTVLPKNVPLREMRLRHAGHGFLHAPVFMGPPQALTATGTMLAAGSKMLFDALEPELQRMTGTVRYFGERADRAAIFKLCGNLMILATIGGIADMFALAEANGITRAEAFTLFEFYSPQGQIDGRGKRMSANDYEPTWTLDMALKDASLMIQSARAGALPIVEAVAKELRDGASAGFGSLDLAALAKPR